MNRSVPKVISIVMFEILSAFVVASTAQAYGQQNPPVAPRDSKPHGMSYEDWAGALLNWVYSQPVDVSPFIDNTGALTQQAESEDVWFLMGPSQYVSQPENLFLTMPTGTALFFSPLGFFGVGPSAMCPTAEACVEWVKTHPLAGGIAAQDVEIDGVPVSDINQYLILSPVVPLHPASGFDPFTFGVFGGFGLFIHPLPPGSHTLHARTTAHFGTLPFDFTCVITVLPGHGNGL